MTNATYADTAYWQFVQIALPVAQLPEGILQFTDACGPFSGKGGDMPSGCRSIEAQLTLFPAQVQV